MVLSDQSKKLKTIHVVFMKIQNLHQGEIHVTLKKDIKAMMILRKIIQVIIYKTPIVNKKRSLKILV